MSNPKNAKNVKSAKQIQQMFMMIGWMAIIASVASAGYSWFGIRPRLNRVIDQLDMDLSGLSSPLKDQNSSEAKIIHLLPVTILTLHGTLFNASQTLHGTAKTTNDVKKGVPGLVLPKNALGIDTALLNKTGEQLRLLSDTVGEMQDPVDDLAKDSSDQLYSRIEGMRDAVKHAELPTHASLLGFAFSICYFFFGCISFTLSYAVAALSSGVSVPGESEQAQKVA